MVLKEFPKMSDKTGDEYNYIFYKKNYQCLNVKLVFKKKKKIERIGLTYVNKIIRKGGWGLFKNLRNRYLLNLTNFFFFFLLACKIIEFMNK